MNIGKRVCSSLMDPYKLHAALWVNIPENYKLYSSYNTEDYTAWLHCARPAWLACAWYKPAFTLETFSSPILSPSSFLSYSVKSLGLRVFTIFSFSECVHIRQYWVLFFGSVSLSG